ncbi:MAG: tetratricopeptide repeat protein [Bacteroidota bacterium]|nr:tetratricopeptide repeat protein [Bacteroidota bacterium]
MKYIYPLILILFLSAFSQADEALVQFEQANYLYRNGDFKNAAILYEKIVHNGYHNSELYYNLGNTYFKLDETGKAILYYERAKKIYPNDEDINFNLKIANLKVVDKIEAIPQLFFIEWWYSASKAFSSDTWAIFTLTTIWLGIILLLLFRISKSPFTRRAFFFGGIFIVAIAGFSLIFSIQQNKSEKSESMAIVFSPSVTVKSSPDEAGTDLFLLHEGVKVEMVDKVGNWFKIKLVDGKIGWLPEKDVEVI